MKYNQYIPLECILKILDDNIYVRIIHKSTIACHGKVKNIINSQFVKEHLDYHYDMYCGGWDEPYNIVTIIISKGTKDFTPIYKDMTISDFMENMRSGIEFESKMILFNIDKNIGKSMPIMYIDRAAIDINYIKFTKFSSAFNFWNKKIFKIKIYPRDHAIRIYIVDMIPSKKKSIKNIDQAKMIKTSAIVDKDDINNIIRSYNIKNNTMILVNKFIIIKSMEHSSKNPIILVDQNNNINSLGTRVSLFAIIDKQNLNILFRIQIGTGKLSDIIEVDNNTCMELYKLLNDNI